MKVIGIKKKDKVHKVIIDIFVWSFLALVCICLFGHMDLLVTANRSYAYINLNISNIFESIITNITEFYTQANILSGDHGANYLPSTFIAFAIWNLPYKLISHAPMYWGDWNIAFLLWNKLFPIIVYLLSGWMLYKILRDNFNLERQHGMLVFFTFSASPIAFFSQFIFCQYDVFTVFLMLCGIYYFFKPDRVKKDFYKFILFFAIATTFKYYAVIIFVVLLVLEFKDIFTLIINAFLVLIPCAIELIFYLITDTENFSLGVFGFGVLEYAEVAGINIGFSSINLLPLSLCIVLVMAYRTRPGNRTSLFKWFIFYSCCICTCLFSLMTWHPQWLIFAVPFWCMLLLTSEEHDFLIFLDIVFSLVFIAFVVNAFVNNVDQNLLKFGLLGENFRYRYDLAIEDTMSKFFPLDKGLLFTVLVAIMIAYCVFAKPKNTTDEKLEFVPMSIMNGIRLRFIIGISAFIIPACLCIPNYLNQDENLWAGYKSDLDALETKGIDSDESIVVQYVTGIGKELTNVSVVTKCTENPNDDWEFTLKIIDMDNQMTIGEQTISGKQININGTSVFSFHGVEIDDTHTYAFMFTSNTNRKVKLTYYEYKPGEVRNEFYAIKPVHYDERIVIGDQVIENASLNMQIYGHYH